MSLFNFLGLHVYKPSTVQPLTVDGKFSGQGIKDMIRTAMQPVIASIQALAMEAAQFEQGTDANTVAQLQAQVATLTQANADMTSKLASFEQDQADTDAAVTAAAVKPTMTQTQTNVGTVTPTGTVTNNGTLDFNTGTVTNG